MKKDKWEPVHNPPDIDAYWKFASEGWSHEYARNILLHWIELKGLETELADWLDKNYPEEE